MRRIQVMLLVIILIASLGGCTFTAAPEAENSNNVDYEQETEITDMPDSEKNNGLPDVDSFKYEYGQLAMNGGGFVTGLIAHPKADGVIYARTDVGGSYRYDKSKSEWESMSYWTSDADKGLLSVDGFALDPADESKIYLIAGCEYFSGGKTAVLISNDKGDSFKQIDVTDMIKVHGNGMGRQNGERIAVDPLNTNTILIGGRTGGLIISRDYGETWDKVKSFPVTKTPNKTGIVSIVFDGKGKVYIGVSQAGTANIFVSDDEFTTWNAIDALPSDLMPQRMKLDGNGNILITYADEAGPWNGNRGAIYRYYPADNTAEDISPNNRPFGDVVFDVNNPEKLVASTINTWTGQTNGAWGDQFFTSENGGKTWREITPVMTIDANGCPWIKGYSIHWAGSLLLDPFNCDKLMVVSGNGIFACDNIWDKKPAFYFNSRGVEETVPLDIMSIPNGPLVTAIGDYDGCVYYDTYDYGKLHSTAIGTTRSIAFGGEDNNVWVKAGTRDEKPNVYISTDSGVTWKSSSGLKVGDKQAKGGSCAVSANGKRIFYSPENAKNTYYTDDYGKSWDICEGLNGGMYILGDTVNNNYIYASGDKLFYVSSDGGISFNSTYSTSNRSERFSQPYGVEGKIILPLGKGYVISTDRGANFTISNDKVTECYAVGVGKAQQEGKPYSIFMYGNAGNGLGVYLSRDDGETWMRINDDLHQFGGKGNGNFIIGDMNEYGKYYFATVGLGVAYGKMVNE